MNISAQECTARAAGPRLTLHQRPPAMHEYGTVAVFADLYGNLWDLIQFA